MIETVFIIDDDAGMRRSISRLLRAENLRNEQFSSAQAFLDREPYEEVGCVLLDVNMPGISGVELHAHLVKIDSDLPVIFLTGYGNISMSVEAMKRGALDFLTKPVDQEDLLSAVYQALAHHRATKQEAGIRESIESRLATLTERESEVMQQLITGAPNKVVADRLHIAIKTVKVHRARLLKKLDVRSVAELVHLCYQVGIEPGPDESSQAPFPTESESSL